MRFSELLFYHSWETLNPDLYFKMRTSGNTDHPSWETSFNTETTIPDRIDCQLFRHEPHGSYGGNSLGRCVYKIVLICKVSNSFCNKNQWNEISQKEVRSWCAANTVGRLETRQQDCVVMSFRLWLYKFQGVFVCEVRFWSNISTVNV